ncbi:unnamed protein product [Rodentolepis nana]|uniref:C2H2-type domain-containing protein n=1 Tax=Rodentolepis nana TaxID=102285 RepID=A0A0R3T012_RODNA|nr:unnamed protein product [Rodentolepis nana]
MKNFAATQSVRCAGSGCECKAFQPRVNAVRQCSGCSHSWVFHAYSKFQNLPPFFGNSLKSDPGLIIVMFETMSMALLGCHAIPTRIKILLDRIWSSSRLQVDLTQFLLSFGWTLQDYTRGYMLTDHKGQLRDRWVSCRIEEEALIIQQFLRFLETRHLAHDMLASLEAEKSTSTGEQPANPHSSEYLLGPLPQNVVSQQDASKKETEVTTSLSSTNLASELSTRFVAAMAAAALTSKMNFPKFSMIPSLSMPSLPSPGWCSGKLEGNGDLSGIPGLPLPPPPPLSAFGTVTSTPMDVNDRKSIPGHFDIWNAPFDNLSDLSKPTLDHKNEIDYATDFSVVTSIGTSSITGSGGKQLKGSRASGNRKSTASESKRQQPNNFSYGEERKQALNGISTTSATSGITMSGRNKKRVLCTTCKKSFCDKGALKIHYSAVHLREMHKCTIKGCNMWFSSRRSRNRHSANPNPRLHMTHLGKKLPDNATIVDDGSGLSVFQRSQMPSTILNPPIISPFIKTTPPHPSTSTTSSIPTDPPSPSSTLLNLSDPSQNNEVSHRRHHQTASTAGSSGDDDGIDEGIYIAPNSTRGEDMEEEDEEMTGHGEVIPLNPSSVARHQRSSTTEFSASNLAQSSPSPPSSLHFEGGSSPQSSQMNVDGGVKAMVTLS